MQARSQTQWAPEGWARSGGAAGVSHDSPRAQTCTFQGSGLQNTTKIQREDTQRDTETAKRWREREEKERNFGRSGGGGSSGGGSGGRWSREVQASNNHNNHNHNNAKPVGPRPLSQARCRVFRGWAQQHTTTKQHNNNTTTTQQQQQQQHTQQQQHLKISPKH